MSTKQDLKDRLARAKENKSIDDEPRNDRGQWTSGGSSENRAVGEARDKLRTAITEHQTSKAALDRAQALHAKNTANLHAAITNYAVNSLSGTNNDESHDAYVTARNTHQRSEAALQTATTDHAEKTRKLASAVGAHNFAVSEAERGRTAQAVRPATPPPAPTPVATPLNAETPLTQVMRTAVDHTASFVQADNHLREAENYHNQVSRYHQVPGTEQVRNEAASQLNLAQAAHRFTLRRMVQSVNSHNAMAEAAGAKKLPFPAGTIDAARKHNMDLRTGEVRQSEPTTYARPGSTTEPDTMPVGRSLLHPERNQPAAPTPPAPEATPPTHDRGFNVVPTGGHDTYGNPTHTITHNSVPLTIPVSKDRAETVFSRYNRQNRDLQTHEVAKKISEDPLVGLNGLTPGHVANTAFEPSGMRTANAPADPNSPGFNVVPFIAANNHPNHQHVITHNGIAVTQPFPNQAAAKAYLQARKDGAQGVPSHRLAQTIAYGVRGPDNINQSAFKPAESVTAQAAPTTPTPATPAEGPISPFANEKGFSIVPVEPDRNGVARTHTINHNGIALTHPQARQSAENQLNEARAANPGMADHMLARKIADHPITGRGRSNVPARAFISNTPIADMPMPEPPTPATRVVQMTPPPPAGASITGTKIGTEDSTGNRTLHLEHSEGTKATGIKVGKKDGRYFAHLNGRKLTKNLSLQALKEHINSRLTGVHRAASDEEIAGHLSRR